MMTMDRTVGQFVVSAPPWPILGACGSHCNNLSANPRLDADNLKDLVIIVHYEIS